MSVEEAGFRAVAEVLLGGIVGMLLGMFGSLFFAYLILFMRPSIEISRRAALSQSSGKRILKIKVANRSRFHAVDLRAELHRVRLKEKSQRITTHKIELVREDPFLLGPRGSANMSDLYVFVSRRETEKGTLADTMEAFEKSRLRFRLIATHPVSGAKRVFEQIFDWDEDVQSGEFDIGRQINSIAPNAAAAAVGKKL